MEEILKDIKGSCIKIFSEQLSGIYIHGSLAFDCFSWDRSDIDFIVVVSSPPSMDQKKRLLTELLRIDDGGPPKGLEMSLVLERDARHFQYPTPFQFHFSHYYKERCIRNPEEFVREMNGTDKDLAAHFTVIRKVGNVLCRKSRVEIFGPVPEADYLDSIWCDAEEGMSAISDQPVSVILNLCRVLAFVEERLVLSKKGGGHWGMDHLPQCYLQMLTRLVNSYSGQEAFVWQLASEQEKELLLRLARDLRERILKPGNG